LATKQLEGRKKDKERITLVVCCNGDGTEKLPLWVIGKFNNPRCFKNVDRSTFGCKYSFNSKAWMTQVIFLQWIKDFDARMAGRKVLLIMDNCSAHVSASKDPSLVLSNLFAFSFRFRFSLSQHSF